MTPELLQAAIGCSAPRAREFSQPITSAMAAYGINTPERRAAFLAQVAVESGSLQWLRELWGPTPQQKKYDPPGALAEELGNTVAGDGFKYRGAGLIETTGKGNFSRLSKALGVDFVADPELLTMPMWASISAAYYWRSHGCNTLADGGNFTQITRAINGGLTAQPERLQMWDRCKKAFGVKA